MSKCSETFNFLNARFFACVSACVYVRMYDCAYRTCSTMSTCVSKMLIPARNTRFPAIYMYRA